MELLPKMLNEMQDSNKMKRCAAFKRMTLWLADHSLTETTEWMYKVVRVCLKSFEDSSERCREEAIKITTLLLLPCQDANILDWVLPAIVTRIGVEPVAEPSEEIRLRLLELASRCITQFPHDIGPRNYIDYFQVLLENCLCDAFPSLKKDACSVTRQLCTVEPQQMKCIAPSLIQTLKKSCLLHKHSSIRVEGVLTFAALLHCGRAVRHILSDPENEPKERSIASILFVLSNDHSESVRLAVIDCLNIILLDMDCRLEYHRHYLPHLLLLSTDSFDAVRSSALQTLQKCGNLYKMDNEDNRIDLEHRHVSLKDVEWYADDEYPDMSTLSCFQTTTITNINKDNKNNISSPPIPSRYAILQHRPSLGQRYVVAESVRNFLDNILRDITSIDWVIMYSNNNRRVVALRILWCVIFHCETAVIQFTQKILSSLYKAVRDEDHEVKVEALLCVELLGKFLEPNHYLPFFIARPAQEENNKVVSLHAPSSLEEQQQQQNSDNMNTDNNTTTPSSVVILTDHNVNNSSNNIMNLHTEKVNTKDNFNNGEPLEWKKKKEKMDETKKSITEDTEQQEENDDDDTVVHKGHKKTVIISSFTPEKSDFSKNIDDKNEQKNANHINNNSKSKMSEEVHGRLPTLFSTAGFATKCAILTSLPLFLRGSSCKLTSSHALKITQALTNHELVECNHEELLECLLQALIATVHIFAERGFIATRERPLPELVLNDVKQRTLDSIILYSALCMKQETSRTVQHKAHELIVNLSMYVSGATNLTSRVNENNHEENTNTTNDRSNNSSVHDVNAIYNLHAKRLLYRYGAAMPVCAFAELVLHTNVKFLPSILLKEIFICKLHEINFELRVIDELRYFQVLEQLLWRSENVFNNEVTILLHTVILPHCNFHAGNAAHLFRKVAVNCLCALLHYDRLYVCKNSNTTTIIGTNDDDNNNTQITNDNLIQCGNNINNNSTIIEDELIHKIVIAWCSASDSDDGEIRLACMSELHKVCLLPMSTGDASEVVQSVLLRLDDGSESIQLRTSLSLLHYLLAITSQELTSSSSSSLSVMTEINAQMVPVVRKLLIYIDDDDASSELRNTLCQCVEKLAHFSANIVIDLVRTAERKHRDAKYCQRILKAILSEYDQETTNDAVQTS